MNFRAHDLYRRTESPLHRVPAGVKMLAVLVVLIGVLAVPAGWAWVLGIVAVFVVLCAVVARLPLVAVLQRLVLIEPIILGVAALKLLQPGGGREFLLIVARSTVCILTMLVLSGTTPFQGIVAVLRRLRVPVLLVTTLWLMHRYLAVLLEESQRMRRARNCRSFTPGRRHAWRMLSTVAGQLFIRSSERAERVYAAMCARGWRENHDG